MSTSSPGSPVPGSDGPRVQPPLLGILGQCPRAHDVDQLSRATSAVVRGPEWSIRYPRLLGPGSEGPGDDSLLGSSDTCPSVRSVDHLLRTTWALVRGHVVSPAAPGDSGPCLRSCGVAEHSRETRARGRGPALSTTSPRGLAHGSDIPQCRQALLCDSGQCPRACDVDHLSRVTRARLRWPAGSTTCPGRLGPVSKGP